MKLNYLRGSCKMPKKEIIDVPEKQCRYKIVICFVSGLGRRESNCCNPWPETISWSYNPPITSKFRQRLNDKINYSKKAISISEEFDCQSRQQINLSSYGNYLSNFGETSHGSKLAKKHKCKFKINCKYSNQLLGTVIWTIFTIHVQFHPWVGVTCLIVFFAKLNHVLYQ